MSTLKETYRELKVEECITEAEFNNLFNTCIRKLESLGPEFKVDRSLLKLEKPLDGAEGFGLTEFIPEENLRIIHMSFSRFLYKRGLEEILKNTVYHEFCHFYQFRDCLKYNIITPGVGVIPDTDPLLINYYIGKREVGGHSALWWKYVEKVNSQVKPTCPISQYVDKNDEKEAMEKLKEHIIATLYCNTCDNEINILAEPPYDRSHSKAWVIIALAYLTTSQHWENYLCGKDGGSLYINIEASFFKAKIESFIKLNIPVLTEVYNNQVQKRGKIDA